MACAGRIRWPWSRTCISPLTMPSMRVTRTTPPAPGSRPSWTSGWPSWIFGSSTTIRRWQASAISSPPPSAAPLMARHDRLAERLQPAQQRLVLAHPAGELVGRLGRDLLEVVEVAAGEERLLGARDDDAGDRVLLGLQALDGLLHRRAEVGVHRVGGLVRVVEDEVDDAVARVLPADRVGGHQMRSTTVAMPMPPPTHSVARP